MILDQIFKGFPHSCGEYIMYTNGNRLDSGYLPDYVLKNGNDYIIIESENTTNRKTFVGGLVKAAHFLQGDKTGSLIFVIVPKNNITVQQIQKHLKKYLNWILDMTNLRDVYIIEAEHYHRDQKVLVIGGADFLNFAKKV